MTQLLRTIRLKYLVCLLNDEEFDTMCSKLRQIFGREYVIQMMCSPINVHVIDVESIEKMSAVVLSIIHNRNPDHSNSTEITTISICTLPTAVVGEIASFLDQQSYPKFAQTNRKLFVDCHSPNRLTKLDLSELEDYNEISFANYPSSKHLKFRLTSALNDISLSEHCRKIDTLDIISVYCSIPYFTQFLNQNIRLFSNITSLSMANFYGICCIPKRQFLSLLSECEALEHLQLYHVDIIGGLERDELQLLWCTATVNHLAIRCSINASVLLSAFSSTLNTLTIRSIRNDQRNRAWFPSDCDWSKLERLCLLEPSRRSMTSMLKRAKGLKEICIFPALEMSTTRSKSAAIEGMIHTVITDYLSIEFIYIETFGLFEEICNAFYRGLFMTQKQARECLEIGLKLDVDDTEDLADFMCNFSRILLMLGASNTKQWIVTLEGKEPFEEDALAESIRKFLASYPDFHIVLKHKSPAQFVIANENCKMLGHHHWWNDCNEILLSDY